MKNMAVRDQAERLARAGRFNEALEFLWLGTGHRGPPPRIELKLRASNDILAGFHGLLAPAARYRKALELLGETAGKPGLSCLRAAMLIPLGRYADAAASCDLALEADASFSWARLWRFRALDGLISLEEQPERLDEAHREIDLVLKREPENANAFAYRAALYSALDRTAEAFADLDRLERLDPAYEWVFSERGHLHSEVGQLDEAARHCTRVVSLYPDKGWPLALRGRAWAHGGRPREGMADLSAAVDREPENAAIRAWRGEARRMLGDLGGALRDFDRALRLNPPYEFAYAWRGKTLLSVGRVRSALRDLDRSVRLRPVHRLYRIWRAEARLKLGRFEGALDDYRKAQPLEFLATWSLPEGVGADQREKVLRADLDRLVRRHPRCAWPYAWRGMVAIRPGGKTVPPSAADDLDRAVALNPKSVWPRLWRAQGLRGSDKYEDAYRSAQAAARVAAGDGWLRAWVGCLELEKGEFREACADFDAAIALEPHKMEIYVWRGMARAQVGRHREALDDFDLVAAPLNNNPSALRWRDECRRRLGLGAVPNRPKDPASS